MADYKECLQCMKPNKPNCCDSKRFKGVCEEIVKLYDLQKRADQENDYFFWRMHGGRTGRGDN